MKIVEAVNTIIANSSKISDVLKVNSEVFFVYNKKYKWSILKNDDGEFSVFIYPDKTKTLNDLAYSVDYSEYTDFVHYSTEEIKTREAKETFSELYQILSEKILGVDDILDEIIDDF